MPIINAPTFPSHRRPSRSLLSPPISTAKFTLTTDNKEKCFSIVIVNFNYGRFLQEAITSVLDQSCQDFELIIVDGGSSDNSKEIISRNSDKLAWWCSEPDRGQSHAFNKGFSRAKGRFLTWLNADDIMFPGALERTKETILANPDDEWFAAGCFWLDTDMRIMKCSSASPFSQRRVQRGLFSVCGPSSFFSRSLYLRSGGIDEDLHYMMDTELWGKFATVLGAKYTAVPGYCWGMRLHPDAKMSGHNFESSPMSSESHHSWNQKEEEAKTIASRYGQDRATLFDRLITTSPIRKIKNFADSHRYKGKHYRQFPGFNENRQK
ncbi:Glycosyl transferase, group 2 family protein [Rhodopirellula islandica]|uniref:Glycosyl transferase, group 2 family protein n=1 Tax=Rhodopirellula islandica TaxID=595434 RepID=A0A0J1B880_RHOIS|nr:glycosyltransferase family 2 protein [Rhodopirellula islandica]KLU02917.1 Glycosyl transferase, group 2 family protein [Rhodopirellula islandica]